jgi:hypothetical protein
MVCSYFLHVEWRHVGGIKAMDATELHLEAGCGASLSHGAPKMGVEDGKEFACSSPAK